MKKILIFFALVFFFHAKSAAGVEIAFTIDPMSCRNCIYKVDTDTDTVAEIYVTDDDIESIAAAPDGRIYFTTYLGGIFRIRHITPLRTPDGIIAYGDETILYEEETRGEPDLINPYGKLAIKTIDHAGNYRLYYSKAGGGSGDGQINYLDDTGSFLPYYTVRLSDIPVASCAGVGGYWNGDFTFDNDNLYLSSGNHIPSALFQVTGAGPSGVSDGDVTQIYDRARDMTDLDIDESGLFYFGESRGSSIYQHNRTTGGESAVFNHPDGQWIKELALLRTPVTLGGAMPLPEFKRFLRPLRAPDLKVAKIINGEPIFIDSGRSAIIPIRIIVKNIGTIDSEQFKIAISSAFPGQINATEAHFIIPGNSDKNYAWHKGIHAGGEAALAGHVEVQHPKELSLVGQNMVIIASVDSCHGDKAMPKYCRVMESNEVNNKGAIRLLLKGLVKSRIVP